MAGITVSTPLFITSTEDLMGRLSRLDTEEARSLLAEVKELHTEFRRWEHHKPPDDIRVKSIRKLFDLQRRTMDYVAKTIPPPATR
jgi:hypothetical protein